MCEGDIVTITVTLSRLGKDRAALVGDAQVGGGGGEGSLLDPDGDF